MGAVRTQPAKKNKTDEESRSNCSFPFILPQNMQLVRRAEG